MARGCRVWRPRNPPTCRAAVEKSRADIATAKTLRLTVPPSLLAFDEVIE